MALRLIELHVETAEDDADARLREALDEVSLHDLWSSVSEGGRLSASVLAAADDAEAVVERLQDQYGGREGFRLVLLDVEATLPVPEEEQQEEEEREAAADESAALSGLLGRWLARVSREELLVDVKANLEIPPVFLLQTVLSTIVAGVGLRGDNVAVIIGAMVIAPLLGPNVALALGATLGDLQLVRRAALVNFSGLALSLGVAVLMGLGFPLDPSAKEVALRTSVSLGDVVLALSVGMAGTLAFTTGVSGRLIGVMVAVALLPPVVVLGMLLGAGDLLRATAAFLLLSTNVICINLAGVATFLLHDVRPRTWYEQRAARRSSRLALIGWTLLLLLLLVAIYLYGLHGSLQ